MGGKVVDLDKRRQARNAAKEAALPPFDMSYAGMCVVNLPHSRTPVGDVWEIESGKWRLRVEPGHDLRDKRKKLCVPFGSRARLMLIYLQTQARLHGTPEVEMGDSLCQWLASMKITRGGNTYRDVMEQIDLINACKLTFIYSDDNRAAFETDVLVRKGIAFNKPVLNSATGELFADKVVLGEKFFNDLMAHPVPLKHEAICALRNKCLAMDAYMWLAYRLHSLTEPTFVPWNGLNQQFGATYKEVRSFKFNFKKALADALQQYPEAQGNVIADGDPAGVILKPSAPPIPKAERTKLLGA